MAFIDKIFKLKQRIFLFSNKGISMKNLSDIELDHEVKNSKQLLLVDFWAAWCGPCKSLVPTLEALSNEHGDLVSIIKINVDENSDSAMKYNIRGIPTLLFIKDGKVLDVLVGNHPKSLISEKIKNLA